MKRLLITGGSGNVGRPLSKLAEVNWDTYSTYYRNSNVGGGTSLQLDLTEADATITLVKEIKPDVIIHTAVSDQSANMYEANRQAAKNMSEAAYACGSRLIALSTDMVFDGKHAPYDDYAPPSPLSPYGKAKAENEETYRNGAGEALIVRTSLVYDLAPYNRQVSWLHKAISADKPVTLFVDEIRHPIWAVNFAEVLLELAELNITGTLNVAGPEAVNRWDYGCKLLAALGYDHNRYAVPVEASNVAPGRPANLTLKLDRIKSQLKRTALISLDDALILAQRD